MTWHPRQHLRDDVIIYATGICLRDPDNEPQAFLLLDFYFYRRSPMLLSEKWYQATIKNPYGNYLPSTPKTTTTNIPTMTESGQGNTNWANALLVDFPSSPRKHQDHGSGRLRCVSFSSVSEVVIIPRDESSLKAYSREEVQLFKRKIALDAHRMRQIFGSSSVESIANDYDHDLLYQSIGLEKYLSRQVYEHITATKKSHLTAILKEQEYQGKHIICDVERLAWVSESSSSWTRNRAEQLASSYYFLLND